MKRLFVPTIFAGLLFQAIPALADSSATATVDWGSLSIEIFDADLTDNITPVFTWTSGSGSISYSATSYAAKGYDTANGNGNSSNWTDVLTKSISFNDAQASAKRSGTTLSASAVTQQTSGSSSDYHGINPNQAYASTNNSGYFSLTGKGFALISVPWSASISSTDSNSSASASVSISGSFSDGMYSNGSTNSNRSLDYWNGGNQNVSSTFSLAVSNAGSLTTTTGNITANISTYATSPSFDVTNPVAEPETYATLLAGLGLIGFMVRRRKIS